MNHTDQSNRALLERLAAKAMTDRGLLADFTAKAISEAAGVSCPSFNGDGVRDLRNLLWASIDNDDSRDLDQLSVAEALPGEQDQSARGDRRRGRGRRRTWRRSTSTPGITRPRSIRRRRSSPCCRKNCSTDITSLGLAADRQAIVVEMVVAERRLGRSSGDLSGVGAEPGQAGLQQRGRLAGRRTGAGGGGRRAGAGRKPPPARQGGPGAEEPAATARGPDVRNASRAGPSSKATRFASWKSKSPIEPRNSSKISWWPPTA